MQAFYLHVAGGTFALVPGRLTAEQLKAGRIQHYPNGVTLHYADGRYLVAEPQGYDDGSTLYRAHRALARAHQHATILATLLPRATQQEAEAPHGVAPYTDAQRLKDAWQAR